jgi:predicted DNA-binding transcriptional regulator AlpA
VPTDPRPEALLDSAWVVTEASPTALPKLALRIAEVAKALGVGRRTIEKYRAAGKFPRPDRHIGKCPVWSPETIRKWIEEGGR